MFSEVEIGDRGPGKSPVWPYVGMALILLVRSPI